jgi:hypothetical protein
LLVLWWFAGSLSNAVRGIPRVDARDRRLLAGLAGAVVSFMVVSLAGTSFRDVNSFAIISLVTGLLVSLSMPERARES